MSFPKPQQGLTTFSVGSEVKRLGFSRPEDTFFEVIEPKTSLARSLVTGEETQLSGSYFVTVIDAEQLPDAQDLENAQPGEIYHHAFTGIDYQVAKTQKEIDTISMINLETGDQSLFPRLGNAQFYKL